MLMHILAGVVEGNYGAVTAIATGFPEVAEFAVQNSWSHPLQVPLKGPNY
jgi:hypothetical protein